MGPLIVLVAMFALLWLLYIMPQRRRMQAQEQVIASVETGDEVITVGGLIGRVSSTRDDELVLEIAPGTEVRVARRSVARVLAPAHDGTEVISGQAVEQDEEAHS